MNDSFTPDFCLPFLSLTPLCKSSTDYSLDIFFCVVLDAGDPVIKR